ncbi:hypothetical protein DM01DRAFT_1335975 [Hesseltinella vesiculosa]|uniref:Uncharacterized protein n=1 Tax=Hesseltinella vesiculosa TaxID=101127 RepID=A0A1X2GJ27_9FUNG|nr:hypothetical protein DM01DRAFT_1335975 [Hesseltinella vesiculosa]
MEFEISSPISTDAVLNKLKNKMDFNDNKVALVNPGETVTSDQQFMRGHGTYAEDDGTVVSAVAGTIERVNKLLTVRPLKSRYTPEIGDIVVGRITEVAMKRWKVDVNGRQDGILLLSSISLPGGIQRRKTDSDELQMREFFAEGHVLVAEIQNIFVDGSMGLHTRGFKFCKLRNGSFVSVPPVLVQRCKSQFHSLPCGVDIVLGMNGYIWVNKKPEGLSNVATDDFDTAVVYSDVNDPMTDDERQDIARVCNCISALAKQFIPITDSIIVYTYEASLQYSIKDMLKADIIETITTEARANMEN